MLIAYVDETGDTGSVSKQGASGCYGLGCVLVDAETWTESFDTLLRFRRSVRDDFGVHMRTEIKANSLIRNSGQLRDLNLSPAQRGLIYKYHLNTLATIKARAFAVVVDKQSARVEGDECLTMAWETLLQRLERTTTHEKTGVMIVHDQGEDASVRKLVRKARRHLTSGSAFGYSQLTNPIRRLVEDPVPRNSQESYFIQLADLVAYAGWRTHVPPSRGVAQVTGTDLWQYLGTSTHAAVNSLSKRGAPGVVLRY
ncbi:MAG: DUF3800 domain-containing protein [Aeromicrobium sp.]|uniref:DUF3800 domain-containing protein n=1 Tax=Aeromicrobium sp. TaxID=1871063 RepID=UPI00261765D8|nr:DUF3800 domain-containing protein [Aeromicrobium sp.]MDF1705052.1 DUF3800 domain-containing protein [Aeromicrobium sp.]